MNNLDDFVRYYINMKASDECKSFTNFPAKSIHTWLPLLSLQNVIVTDPIRISFIGSGDLKLSFNATSLGIGIKNDFERAQKVLSSVCDYIHQGRKETIVVPITFGTGVTYHTNVLIINTVRREFERFEPYGHYRMKSEIVQDAKVFRLDQSVNNFLQTGLQDMCPVLSSFKYITTADFCPQTKSPQSIQEKDVIKKVAEGESVEFKGFCTVWSMMYAHLRILFNNKTGEQILSELLSSVKKAIFLKRRWDLPTAMTKLVQRYACHLEGMTQTTT